MVSSWDAEIDTGREHLHMAGDVAIVEILAHGGVVRIMRVRWRQLKRVCTLNRDYRPRTFGEAGRGGTAVVEFALVAHHEAERRIVWCREHVAIGGAIGRHKADHGAVSVSRKRLAHDESRGHNWHERRIDDGLRRRRVSAAVKLDEVSRPHRADVEMAHRA
jgi:hypothetical protein